MSGLPDETVIAIYDCPDMQKNIALDFGVSVAAVAQIKTMKRHAKLIRRVLADRVRSRYAMLATMACAPDVRRTID